MMNKFLQIMLLLCCFQPAFAAVTVIAPTVTIQQGGILSVIWRAPLSQTYKISVFVPNNATAVNVLYHVYPKGKLANSTSCLSTDAVHPCFEIPVNQALNKGKWVQLKVNQHANTQWTFVKNSGFVTVASDNLSTTEKLGVAGINFIGTALSDQQISARWAKAFTSVSGIRTAISRCMNDNAGVIAGLCDSAGYPSDYYSLGKYGIYTWGLDDLNNGTTSSIKPNTQVAIISTKGAIQLTETIPGSLGGCTFQIVPSLVSGTGTITWNTVATAFIAPSTSLADCANFISGYSHVWYNTVDTMDTVTSAKWRNAIAAASGVKQAINQCLKDHGGVATGLCDSATDDSTNLGKYGITISGLNTMNWNAQTQIAVSTAYGANPNMVSIDITETTAGSLGGCAFHLVPTVQGGAGTIVWHIAAAFNSAPAAADADCVKYVKGSETLSSIDWWSGSGGGYIYQQAFRAKWAKAIASVSGIKQAINRCLKDSKGIAMNLCDAAIDDGTNLGKYGITGYGLSTLNAMANAQTQVSVNPTYGANANDMVSIDIMETWNGSLGGCAFHLVPEVIPRTGGTIIWRTLAQAVAAPAVADTDCVGLVKGSEAAGSIVW